MDVEEASIELCHPKSQMGEEGLEYHQKRWDSEGFLKPEAKAEAISANCTETEALRTDIESLLDSRCVYRSSQVANAIDRLIEAAKGPQKAQEERSPSFKAGKPSSN